MNSIRNSMKKFQETSSVNSKWHFVRSSLREESVASSHLSFLKKLKVDYKRNSNRIQCTMVQKTRKPNQTKEYVMILTKP